MGSLRCALCAFGLVWIAASAQRVLATPPVVQLTVHPMDKVGGQGGALGREIARQAILLSAREEFGASTRDAALRETFLTDKAALDLDVHYEKDPKAKGVIVTLSGPDKTAIWTQSQALPPPPQTVFDYLTEISAMEALSRHEIADALKKAGLQGTALPWQATGAAPEDIGKRLGEWNLLSQFWALRELRAAIRDHGESPECLGALVRTYAQLGVSARILSGNEYAVYQARALLYAERLMVKDQNSAWALWHRAFARALSGLPAAALDDLATAKKAAGDKPAPSWVLLIDEYCRYQTSGLLAAAKEGGPDAGMAAELAFQTVRNQGINAYRMRIAQEAAHADPRCDMPAIAEFLCDHSGPGDLNSLVEMGPKVMEDYLPQYLFDMPGVPPDVVDVLGNLTGDDPVGDEAVIGKDLVGEADDGAAEPSWSSLGRMLQDLTYAHVWRRAFLIKAMWGISADDYVSEALPLIDDHPLKELVARFGEDGPTAAETFIKQHLDETDIAPSSIRLCFYMAMDQRQQWSTRYLADRGATAQEWDEALDMSLYPKNSQRLEQWDLKLSPWSPLGVAGEIQADWPAAEATRSEWEPRLKDNPLIARVLTLHFQEARDFKQAAVWARKWIDGSPDVQSYGTLADIYDHLDDQANWRATVDEFIEKGDAYGLERQLMEVRVALRLMDAGQYTDAWPYAKTAAQSGAAWATLIAVRCANGLGDWKDAEAYVVEVSNHYDTDAADWYLWCQQTGKGDLAAARDLVQKQDSFWANPDIIYSKVAFYELEGQDDKAAELLEKDLAQYKNPWFSMYLALLYDEEGKKEQRDHALKVTIDLGAKAGKIYGPELAKLATAFQECLKANSTAQITPEWAAPICKSSPEEEPLFRYFIGRFLDLRGRPDDAKEYYLKSIWFGPPQGNRFNAALIGARLRKLGMDPNTPPPATQPATNAATRSATTAPGL